MPKTDQLKIKSRLAKDDKLFRHKKKTVPPEHQMVTLMVTAKKVPRVKGTFVVML